MLRPVWLLSMDSERFCAPPTTTGALKAYFLAYGRTAAQSEVELIHFLSQDEAASWLEEAWGRQVISRANAALETGLQPVFGFSCYTWNAAEFIELARQVKKVAPNALVVAGGPQVHRAEDFLYGDGIDVVVLGEGEGTFAELLDCASRAEWDNIAGCAYLTAAGGVHRTAPRERVTALDRLPSALDIIPLRNPNGSPRYQQVAYETTRGCPYRCSFCEWGTGATGTKMHQFSLDRIRRDFERLVAGGVRDIWLCDSNFGALKEDVTKAEIVAGLRRETGLPRTFATSWSKNHNRRVQQIVRLLHQHGLLSHYHLGLQTLTPRALELSHRTNMRANDYEPVVKLLAAEGVPVAAELIWGLPGDTLAEFEANLDHLLSVFPNINIFGYTLLPGTEFCEKRDEYSLETIPVAGYGKVKGEYVVGCHTFSRDQGEEGYFLITSYILLVRGQLMPLAARFLAFTGRVPVAALLRAVLRTLLEEFSAELPWLAGADRMSVYERRAEFYLHCLSRREKAYTAIKRTLAAWLVGKGAGDLSGLAAKVLELDAALCPRTGATRRVVYAFDFSAHRVEQALSRMEYPDAGLLADGASVELKIDHPGGAGQVLLDPDGGEWMRGRIVAASTGKRLAVQGFGDASHALSPQIL